MKAFFLIVVLSLFATPLTASQTAAVNPKATSLTIGKRIAKKELRKEVRKMRKHKDGGFGSMDGLFYLLLSATIAGFGLLGLLFTAIFKWGAIGWAISGGLIGAGIAILLIAALFI